MTDIIDAISHTEMRSAAETVQTVYVHGDTVPRFQYDSNGLHSWGSGSAAPDVIVGRTGAGVLGFTSGLLASPAPVNLTAATLTVSPLLHDGKIITVNAAAGTAITLPAATGSGLNVKFFIGTTITSNSTTIKVANSSDTMVGFMTIFQDGGSTGLFFEIGGTDDTITLDGTTKGGIKGDYIELIDIATNLWYVRELVSGTGTEAINTSATV